MFIGTSPKCHNCMTDSYGLIAEGKLEVVSCAATPAGRGEDRPCPGRSRQVIWIWRKSLSHLISRARNYPVITICMVMACPLDILSSLSCWINLYARRQPGQEPVEGAKVVHQSVHPQPRDRLTLTTLELPQICWMAGTCCWSELVF